METVTRPRRRRRRPWIAIAVLSFCVLAIVITGIVWVFTPW
jgi:hypothetical protein